MRWALGVLVWVLEMICVLSFLAWVVLVLIVVVPALPALYVQTQSLTPGGKAALDLLNTWLAWTHAHSWSTGVAGLSAMVGLLILGNVGSK